MLAKYFQYVIGYLIGTNIYIAIVSTSFALSGFLLFRFSNYLENSLFVFFATQTAYNLQRYFKWRKNIAHAFIVPFSPSTIIGWAILIGISFIPACVYFTFLNTLQIELLVYIALLTCLYLFVNPLTKKLTGLRYIPYVKTFLVAFCWTALFFILTFDNNHFLLLQLTWVYWLILFLEIWQACILFDLRDVEVDKNDVKTFANTFSTKWIYFLWALISIVLIFMLLKHKPNIILLILIGGISLVQTQTIFYVKNKLLFTFLIDGSLIIYALINYLAFYR